MSTFRLEIPTKLFFGPGVLGELPAAVRNMGRRALIVTGKNSVRRTGVLDKVVGLLQEAAIESVIFEEITPNPLSSQVKLGVQVLKANGCDLVVGLGGGSAVDAAKAIAMCAVNPGEITDYQPGGFLAETIPTRSLPVVAIVTTAGTGTEINHFLVITNDQTLEKPGIGFPCNYPTVGIVDPELMLTMPPTITADTGVDVLFHALEAYVSKGANLFSDLIATQAIKLVVNHLERVIADGADLEARTKLAWASTLAGLAIDIAGTVVIHSAAHPISGRLDKTHGQTLAALGVAYLRHNQAANPEKFATLAQLLGSPEDGLPSVDLAAKSPDALRSFLQKVGRDITLSSLGVTPELIPTLVADTFRTMSGGLENNPKPVTPTDLERLYRESL